MTPPMPVESVSTHLPPVFGNHREPMQAINIRWYFLFSKLQMKTLHESSNGVPQWFTTSNMYVMSRRTMARTTNRTSTHAWRLETSRHLLKTELINEGVGQHGYVALVYSAMYSNHVGVTIITNQYCHTTTTNTISFLDLSRDLCYW